MVDVIIFSHMEENSFSVKVKSTRASKCQNGEVSVAHAEGVYPNVNTLGVPTIANGEDSVSSTGVNTQGAPMSPMMGPHVHPRRKRMDSVGATEVDLGCAHVGRNAEGAPSATPWVT